MGQHKETGDLVGNYVLVYIQSFMRHHIIETSLLFILWNILYVAEITMPKR